MEPELSVMAPKTSPSQNHENTVRNPTTLVTPGESVTATAMPLGKLAVDGIVDQIAVGVAIVDVVVAIIMDLRALQDTPSPLLFHSKHSRMPKRIAMVTAAIDSPHSLILVSKLAQEAAPTLGLSRFRLLMLMSSIQWQFLA